jgi:cation diffusion facilitator CzcD-associated flavoprotein CzcO
MAPPTISSASGPADKHFDILVIGGGISGINASHRISTLLPHASFAVLESRHEIGGTWSQFKYPGVRSDSDLHTFGFPFNPWKSSNTIASGESIMEYMNETVQKFDLAKYMRFGQRVKSADWITEEQRWRVQVDVTAGDSEGVTKVVYWTKWIITGTGYYNYEQPAKANVAGLETFRGHVVRPQFWPTDLELKDKRIVVVGSGATTITLLPALVKEGVKSVTQLQRSPSYVLNVPQEKPGEETWVQRMMPAWLFARWTRTVYNCKL